MKRDPQVIEKKTFKELIDEVKEFAAVRGLSSDVYGLEYDDIEGQITFTLKDQHKVAARDSDFLRRRGAEFKVGDSVTFDGHEYMIVGADKGATKNKVRLIMKKDGSRRMRAPIEYVNSWGNSS